MLHRIVHDGAQFLGREDIERVDAPPVGDDLDALSKVIFRVVMRSQCRPAARHASDPKREDIERARGVGQ